LEKQLVIPVLNLIHACRKRPPHAMHRRSLSWPVSNPSETRPPESGALRRDRRHGRSGVISFRGRASGRSPQGFSYSGRAFYNKRSCIEIIAEADVAPASARQDSITAGFEFQMCRLKPGATSTSDKDRRREQAHEQETSEAFKAIHADGSFSKRPCATRRSPGRKVAFAKPHPPTWPSSRCGPEAIPWRWRRASNSRADRFDGRDGSAGARVSSRTSITNAAFDCGEAEALPYANESFDLVTCQMLFHHIRSRCRARRNGARRETCGRIVVIDTLARRVKKSSSCISHREEPRPFAHRALRLTTFLNSSTICISKSCGNRSNAASARSITGCSAPARTKTQALHGNTQAAGGTTAETRQLFAGSSRRGYNHHHNEGMFLSQGCGLGT